jgi:hypothetical protein
MAKPWNRKTRREMSRYGLGQKVMEEQFDKIRSATKEAAYTNAFAAMLLALHQMHGFGYKRIRAVAVQTIRNINGSMCASELVEQLKAATGFDVNEPLRDDEVGMEVE